eukprot:GGOE01053888.1.p2 GENE.GGOE01053888.1~~GGOE01053888.1.p2  ORF type:complete len:564 (+),score=204.89 GGOE01053888.1:25-1692(+)
MAQEPRRILIVGGVAGGATCAARARRISEKAEIIVLERGPYVSFANCGLPYYVGNVIADEKKLILASPELFKNRFRIEVRLENEVTAIDRERCVISVKDWKTGKEYEEKYDALVLSPGAAPVRPPMPGINLPGVFVVRTIPDSNQIRQWIDDRRVKHAVVVGGGFIGLEMAENLVTRGVKVTLLQREPQVLMPLDPEMASPIHDRIRKHGVELQLLDGAAGFEEVEGGKLQVSTTAGAKHLTDLVVLGIGVRPETSLARKAGLKIGERGGTRVNFQMQTNDPKIWAVGDAVENLDFVTGEHAVVPLAGPANRQGRVAADAIFERSCTFRGVQGTAVCGLFGLTAACTGSNERMLKQLGRDYDKVYLHPAHHVGYYPDAKPIFLKVLFAKRDGKVLGAQAVGEEGVEKRIDVISVMIQMGGTVMDLMEVELCYAPQYGAAKDPINMAGMIATNSLRGDAPLVHWSALEQLKQEGTLLDVRNPDEVAAGHIPGAVNIPLPELRDRLGELDPTKKVFVYCQVGQRGYYATRVLRLNGLDAYNLSGGYKTYLAVAAVAH